MYNFKMTKKEAKEIKKNVYFTNQEKKIIDIFDLKNEIKGYNQR